MIFRKYIGRFLILAMLAAQLALAQHATVHFLEDGHAVSQAQSSDSPAPAGHGKANKDKICQICLFSKGLSHAFLFAGAEIPAAEIAAGFVVPRLQTVPARHEALLHEARGPPSFLS
jgi:hypothetical protein